MSATGTESLWDRVDPELPSIADLTRADLPSINAGYLKRGAWNKADVYLALTKEGRYAVKDYAAKSWLVRLTGAMQLERESRAYKALEGMMGVPRLAGKIDKDAIIMEFVEGVRLQKFHKLRPLPHLIPGLMSLLREVHERGVVHNDIRSRENILVTPAGRIYLIDFSSASNFQKKGLKRFFFMPVMAGSERRALLKWKEALAPELMTESERVSFRRFGFLRSLWPFNPKKDLVKKNGEAEKFRALGGGNR
jgi:predicted Ser/Thr protein kinase